MNLIEQLKQIPDPRSLHGRRFPLWLLLLLALIGSLCGYRGYRPLSAFCKDNYDDLQSLLALPETLPTPSFSTFRRLFVQVEDKFMAVLFNQWCLCFMRPTPGSWVGGDGKSIRCTRSDNGGNYLSTVTLFTHTSGQVIAFALLENAKTSEITLMRQCIELYQDIPELTYTFDALHCQKETVAQIVRQNQHYLIAVKGNQKKLYRTLTEWVKTQTPLSVASVRDLTHGRRVIRQLSVYPMPDALQSVWDNSQCVLRVIRKGVRDSKPFCHESLYLSDVSLRADEFLPRVQSRWEIENRLHWVRDVTFNEDNPPRLGGHAPVNWSVIHCWLITIVRQLGYLTIPDGIRGLTNRVHKVFNILMHGFSST